MQNRDETREATRIVREKAAGRWLEILARLAPEIDPAAFSRPGKHVTCPVHGTGHANGRGDGFRLFRDVAETGGGVCNQCGAKPDGFALLMWLKDWSFPEALDAVSAVLGMSGEVPAVPARSVAPVPTPKSNNRRDAFILKMRREAWAGSVALTEPTALPAHRYLAKRGLSADPLISLGNIRFHPELEYVDEDGVALGRWPCILAGVEDDTGRAANLHRTYITQMGDKAPVPEPRMMMPNLSGQTISGGCVKLGAAGKSLGVAEGLETAVAVSLGAGTTCWSLIAASLMELFVPPEGIEQLIIWADLDRNDRGRQAALVLQKRAWALGIKAQVHLPSMAIPDGKKGIDWNDVWSEFGRSGFPRPAALDERAVLRAVRA